MIQPELGFLMLSSHLGKPDREILTVSQLRRLAQAMQKASRDGADRELSEEDLIQFGFDFLFAHRVIELLDSRDLLESYLVRGHSLDCIPLTWASPNYPAAVKQKLREEAPGCIWARGDLSLLEKPMISAVGSRKLMPSNARFAYELGKQAARSGFVLVSGNAVGADRAFQQGALDAGGSVIAVVADNLCGHPMQDRMLYLSEDDFDARFTNARAISRNRLIHTLGSLVFVAQCALHSGGTWSGTYRNLKNHWCPVYAYEDGSPALAELKFMGARGIVPSQTEMVLSEASKCI